VDDAEVRGFVSERICDEVGLDRGHASRLRGQSLQALRDDALQLRKELGLPALEPSRKRTADGRFISGDMNRRIREALGRG
jgi:hypothetical protein